jgi:MoaA/NifB/PqqE/SkfB family radical SAM enzyme
MCPQSWEEAFSKYRPEFNMPMETFVKIAEEVFPTSTFVDLRGFGETTILPYWPEVVDYLDRYPFVTWHLVTNLSLPRDHTWDKMIKQGFNLGFSCDGATAETFESIRVRSRFERIQHNMEVIQDSIERHKSGWLYFISTIQRKNLHELRAIVEMARKYNFTEVQFKMMQGDVPKGANLSHASAQEILENVDAALDAGLDLGVRVTFNDWIFTKDVDPQKVQKASSFRPRPHPDPFYVFDKKFWQIEDMSRIHREIENFSQVSVHQSCFKPYSFYFINYEAKMGTCNHMMFPFDVVMGDLKFQDFMEIWNGHDYVKFRQQLLEARPQDPRCQWCFKHRMDD